MRWGQHWRISGDTYLPKRSLIFQLGSIMPDWFDRHPIHRWVDTKELFLDRVCKVAQMKPGIRRSWYLGFIAHFACDYCTMAHNEEYYNFYKHRIYEVLAQKYDKKIRKEKPGHVKKWMNAVDIRMLQYAETQGENEAGDDAGTNVTDPIMPDEASVLRKKACYAVETCTEKLHTDIAALHSPDWFRDRRVAELDIRYAYALLKVMIGLIEGGN